MALEDSDEAVVDLMHMCQLSPNTILLRGMLPKNYKEVRHPLQKVTTAIARTLAAMLSRLASSLF